MMNNLKDFWRFFAKLEISIPFHDVILEMPAYGKFLKGLISNKGKIGKK